MTLMPSEQPQPKPPESATQKEIVVPKYIIRPFARGLSQMAWDPLEKLREELLKIRPTDITADNLDTQTQQRGQLSEMKQAFNALTATLVMMRTSGTVKIVPHSEKGGQEQYKLVFSHDTKKEEKPRGLITIKKPLTKLLRIAVSDSLWNKLAIVLGYAELLSSRGSSDELKEQGGKILEQAQELKKRWGLLQEGDNTAIRQIEILTDAQGKTTLTPIPRPTPAPQP